MTAEECNCVGFGYCVPLAVQQLFNFNFIFFITHIQFSFFFLDVYETFLDTAFLFNFLEVGFEILF